MFKKKLLAAFLLSLAIMGAFSVHAHASVVIRYKVNNTYDKAWYGRSGSYYYGKYDCFRLSTTTMRRYCYNSHYRKYYLRRYRDHAVKVVNSYNRRTSGWKYAQCYRQYAVASVRWSYRGYGIYYFDWAPTRTKGYARYY